MVSECGKLTVRSYWYDDKQKIRPLELIFLILQADTFFCFSVEEVTFSNVERQVNFFTWIVEVTRIHTGSKLSLTKF